MKDTLFGIIIISILGSYICSLLNVEGRLYRYVAYIVSLTIIIMLTEPLVAFVSIFRETQNYFNFEYEQSIPQIENEGVSLILKETDSEIRMGISKIAKYKFDILLEEENIIIQYNDSDNENIEIIKITLCVSDNPIIKNLNEFRLYISELFMCECEVA